MDLQQSVMAFEKRRKDQRDRLDAAIDVGANKLLPELKRYFNEGFHLVDPVTGLTVFRRLPQPTVLKHPWFFGVALPDDRELHLYITSAPNFEIHFDNSLISSHPVLAMYPGNPNTVHAGDNEGRSRPVTDWITDVLVEALPKLT